MIIQGLNSRQECGSGRSHAIMCPGCLAQFKLGLLSLLANLSYPAPPRRCPDSLKFCPREGGWSSVGRELEMYPTSLILKFSFSQQEPPESLLCTVYVRGGGIRAVLRQEGQWDNNSRGQELGSLVPASSLKCLGLRAKVHFHIPKAK